MPQKFSASCTCSSHRASTELNAPGNALGCPQRADQIARRVATGQPPAGLASGLGGGGTHNSMGVPAACVDRQGGDLVEGSVNPYSINGLDRRSSGCGECGKVSRREQSPLRSGRHSRDQHGSGRHDFGRLESPRYEPLGSHRHCGPRASRLKSAPRYRGNMAESARSSSPRLGEPAPSRSDRQTQRGRSEVSRNQRCAQQRQSRELSARVGRGVRRQCMGLGLEQAPRSRATNGTLRPG